MEEEILGFRGSTKGYPSISLPNWMKTEKKEKEFSVNFQ